MTLRVPDHLLQEIRRHGELAYPAECCGVIAGRARPVKEAVQLVPMPNERTDDPHRYLIDSDQLRAVERWIGTEGWEILGYYHSHPDHPAAPSAYDTKHAWPWYSYLIVQVEKGNASALASWVLHDEEPRMLPEPLEVLGSGAHVS